ncbi:MAG: hypothetical protein ACE5EA_06875 [Nitrospirota bacterium]
MEDRLLKKTLLSWAIWTGKKEIIQEAIKIEDNGQLLRGFDKGKIKEILSKIAASLYLPVSEDFKGELFDTVTPWVDSLYRSLSDISGIKPLTFWPGDAPYTLLVTHDIDRITRTYQKGLGLILRRKIFDGLNTIVKDYLSSRGEGINPFFNFYKIKKMEEGWGIRSAFYILREKKRWEYLLKMEPQHIFGLYDPAYIADIMERLGTDGFEIGLHGSLDIPDNQDALSYELEYLHTIFDRDIININGIRMHYLRFSKGLPEILLKKGFVYDSTMGFNFSNGFRCGTSFPFVLVGGENINDMDFLLELPFQVMDTALSSQSSDVSQWFKITNKIYQEVKRSGGVLIINWHQRFCNRDEFPDYYNLFTGLIENAISDGAWITTPVKCAKWWGEQRIR